MQKSSYFTVVESLLSIRKRLVITLFMEVKCARQSKRRQVAEYPHHMGSEEVPAKSSVAVVEGMCVLHHKMRGDCRE